MSDAIWISRLPHDEVAAALASSEGPLAGLRVAVKDNIDVAGFPTTAACPSFSYAPSSTAPAVARLTAQGATVIGKTNLDQFATGLVGTRSPLGEVGNPIRPGYISGGSSSGSAAAVALGLADLGVATDTAGSGRVPAALCGLVGLKGTRGWVPNLGVVPACPSFDCTTVLARTLAEAAAGLRTMAGFQQDDPSARLRPAGRFPTVSTIGTVGDDDLVDCSSEVIASYFKAIEAFKAAGFETRTVDLTSYYEAGTLLYEGAFVAERHAAIGAFVAEGSDDVDPSVATIVNKAGSLSASAYAADRMRLAALAAEAQRIWLDVDAVVLPTVPFHPTLDEVRADPLGVNLALGRFVSGANLVDWCAAAIPVDGGSSSVGVQLLGPAWSDEVVWQAAATYLGEALPDPSSSDDVLLAVLGAHLEGQPLNHQLTSRGGTLVELAQTAEAYRMVVLDGPLPKPGLVRDDRIRASVEVEVWRLDHLGFGEFVDEVPGPLTIGTLELIDGRTVKGFLCESEAADAAPDISEYGGWRNWISRST